VIASVNISGDNEEVPQRLSGAAVTASTLRLIGVRPVIGRMFEEADEVEGAPPVMLISFQTWQQRFGGDPTIVGAVLRANGVLTTVAGILPEGFEFPYSQQIWQPLRIDPDRTPWGTRTVRVIGRLRDGATPEAASQDLNAIAARLAQEQPETNAGMGVHVERFGEIGDQDRAMLFIMLAAVAGVLIIACVNVTNLLIGRAIVRTKEVGIRVALGASRIRVAMPFLAESVVLAMAGALVGIAIAYVSNGIFVRSIELADPPFWFRWGIEGDTLVFVASAAVTAAILAGVMPALQAARMALHDTLKDESRGASSFRLGRASRWLVIAEIALSVALLVGAGLVVRSANALNTFDLGVDADAVFIGHVELPAAMYGDAEARRRFTDDLQVRLAALPGVRVAALSASIPGRYGGSMSVEIEGMSRTARSSLTVRTPIVSPGYFRLFADGPVRGRIFEAYDDEVGENVVVVNEAFERRWLDGGEAVGRRVRLGDAEARWSTIVGVVPDLHESGVENAPPPAIYRPLAQAPISFITIAARTDARPLDLAAPIRDQLAAVDPDLPLFQTGTLRSIISGDNFRIRIAAGLFAMFGVAALLLSAVGLYGVMSFAVGQRRREVGVRMAIGARPADVLRLIVGQGLRQVALGLAIGAFLAVGLGRLMTWALFRVSPADPLTFASIGLLMTSVSLLACGVPAVRASRVDPLESLRTD
jgi:predicted permease